MSGRLADKVLMVTGGASGIGFAGARLAASEGARVVLTDHGSDDAQRAADGIGGAVTLIFEGAIAPPSA